MLSICYCPSAWNALSLPSLLIKPSFLISFSLESQNRKAFFICILKVHPLTFYLLFLFSIYVSILSPKGFPGGLAVTNLPAIQKPEETWVHSLDQEDPLEKGMATHFCLAGYSPWGRKELDTTEASSYTCFSPNENVLCLVAQPCPTLQTESTNFLSSFFNYSHHKAFC